MIEKVVPHERMVTFGMVFGQADILIHIESDDILEGDLAVAVHGSDLIVAGGVDNGAVSGAAGSLTGVGVQTLVVIQILLIVLNT